MVGSSLAVCADRPQYGEATIDNCAQEGIPDVQGEHDYLYKHDEHREDGDSYVEVRETADIIISP